MYCLGFAHLLPTLYTKPSLLRESRVEFCHQHNLVDSGNVDAERRFGLRVTLPANDTMRKILGNNWEKLHWYASEKERDEAFEKMAARHGYNRDTDSPTQVLEKIVR